MDSTMQWMNVVAWRMESLAIKSSMSWRSSRRSATSGRAPSGDSFLQLALSEDPSLCHVLKALLHLLLKKQLLHMEPVVTSSGSF